MKTYKFELTVREGYDHFWDSIIDKIGADEVVEIVNGLIGVDGFLDYDLKLIEFKQT